jgi:hypothetical protein
MEKSRLTKIGRTAKRAVIGAIKGTGETAEAIVETTRDLLRVSLDGVAEIAVATEKAAGQIVAGAIEASVEVGGDVMLAVKSAVRGTVRGAAQVGAEKVLLKLLAKSVRIPQKLWKVQQPVLSRLPVKSVARP